MKPAARLGDTCTGHPPCFPPRPCTQGSPDVMIDSKPAHRVGDAWALHCCSGSCHPSMLVQGSPTVMVNGKPLGRIGDMVACGSRIATGSPTTLVG